MLSDSGPDLPLALGAPGEWTETGPVATTWASVAGALRIDVVSVETPHRLQLALDPATTTFGATWRSFSLHHLPVALLRRPEPA